MQGETFSAGRNKMTIYYDRGTVAGKDKNLETRVSGGGGGGYSYQGTGATAPVHITSTTIIHDKIYLQKEDGKERAVELTNWDVACREGHDMVVTWIIPEGKETGNYVGIKNITTGSELFNDDAIKKLADQHFIKNKALKFLAVIAGGFILYKIGNGALLTVGIIAFIAYEIYVGSQTKKATKVVKKYLNDLLVTQN